jgi:hypothetical protein
MSDKRSLSYEEIIRTNPEEINTDLLDDASLARMQHVGRFMRRIAKAMRKSGLKVSDAFTEDDLQKLWKETAEKGTDIGKCPLIH